MSQIHRMKLLVAAVLTAFSMSSYAGSNIIRVMAPVNYVDPDTWQLTSPFVSAWGAGTPISCEPWAPDPLEQAFGSTFGQLQSCFFEQRRTVQSREVNQKGEVRDKGEATTESQQTQKDQSRTLSWVALPDNVSADEAHATTLCNDWTPDPGSVSWGTSFSQVRTCVITTPYMRQARETISSLGIVREKGQPTSSVQEQSNNETRSAVGIKDVWVQADPVVGAWTNGANTGCDAWTPDPLTRANGSTFQQTQACQYNRTRSVQAREVNQSGALRNNGEATTETEQASRSTSRSLTWLAIADDVKTNGAATTTCQTWTPDTSTVDWAQDFTQTRKCDISTPYVKQARESIASLDLVRNVGNPVSYGQASTKNESRTSQGTRDVWASTDPVLGSWVDGANTSCDAWTPDPLTRANGSTFQQSQACYYTKTRSVQLREINQAGALRNSGVASTESQQATRSNARSLSWTPLADEVKTNGTPTTTCAAWTPEVSTVDWGTSFNQTRDCAISTPYVKQSRETIVSLSLVRNVGNSVPYAVASSKTESRSSTGTKDVWTNTSPVLGNWVDGANTRCDAWTPDPMSRANGSTFQQSQTCYFPQTRSVQAREINQSGALRNNGVATTQTQESSRSTDRSLSWVAIADDVKTNGSVTTSCAAWTPEVGTIDFGKSFTQTRACNVSTPYVKQARESISSLGLTRNVGSADAYSVASTKSESQSATGTKDVWASTSPVVGNWVDGANTRCDAWTPDPLTRANGSTFQQSQACYFTQTRTVQAREVNQAGAIRNSGAATTQTQEGSRSTTRSLSWVALADEVKANGTATQSCAAWTPAVSTVDWGQSFTQTRACNVSTPYVKQARESIASLGLTRNVGSSVAYSEASSKTESQSATGTQDVWTATSSVFGNWVDGANTRCDAWTPDPMSQGNGSTFQQSQTCYFPQTRSVQAREVNQAGAIRNSGAATTQTQNASRATTRNLSWVALADEVKTNGSVTNSCAAWTPAENTVEVGVKFNQTRACTATTPYTKQSRESISSLGLTRNVGSLVAYSQSTPRTETQTATGTQPLNRSLAIINPVPGVNGIYSISNGNGGSYQAYVDMTTNGGYWILLDRWVNSIPTKTMGQVAFKGMATSGSTDDANYPVIPNGTINTSSQVLFVPGHSGWIASYGAWQTFNTFAQGTVIGSAGFAITTPNGASTLYGQSAGWQGTTSSGSIFGLWTQWGNGGSCGGDGRVGSNKMCVIAQTQTANNHYDISFVKHLYLRATN